jgi:acyl-CoA thioester hydrolase
VQGDGHARRDAGQEGPRAGEGLRALSSIFRHTLRVRYNECDPQNAVFNANYLTYFDITISELWRRALGGYTAMLDEGIDMVVAEATVRYLAPLRFDEQFDVLATVAQIGTTSLVTEMVVERDGERMAEGEIRHVFIAVDGGKATPIPESIRGALQRYTARRPPLERPT